MSKIKSFLLLISTFVLLLSCGGDTRVETPALGDVLGANIESLKQDMSEAELVFSGDEFSSGRIKNEFEWEYIPKQSKSKKLKNFASDLDISEEELNTKLKFDKVLLSAKIDRNDRVVSVVVRNKFETVNDFRSYYTGKLLAMMQKYEANKKGLLCLNVETSPLGSKEDVEKFELGVSDVFNWEKVKRCEQVGIEGRHGEGRGKPAVFGLSLNASRKPEDRNKKNKGDRQVIESAEFKGY
jgi:hypothetical protein